MHQQMITNQLPTIVFNTSITPMKVHYTISYEPLAEFLVHICAIIGGVFAAASIFESMLHQGFCMISPLSEDVLKAQKRKVKTVDITEPASQNAQ